MYKLVSVTRDYPKGLTLVMVTHDSGVARRAQQIGLMRDGRLQVSPVRV